MSRYHHGLRWTNRQQRGHQLVGPRVGLVALHQLGRQDAVEGKARGPGQVHQQGHAAVRERGQHKTRAEADQASNRVWPRRQMVPGQDQAVEISLSQSLESKLADHLVETRSMQLVEHLPGELALADPVQEGLITLPPRVGNGPSIKRKVALGGDRDEFGDDPAAPIDDRTEDVEGKHLYTWRSVAGHAAMVTPGPGSGRSDRSRRSDVAGCPAIVGPSERSRRRDHRSLARASLPRPLGRTGPRLGASVRLVK